MEEFLSSIQNCDASLVLEAQEEVAYSSPDHAQPWGTKNDNSKNPRFNQKLYKLYSQLQTPLRVLDLGCSGGGFVRSCINEGCFAVGIEGSDYSRRHKRCEWAVIPEFLFTADITRKFRLSLNDGQ